jgi:VWFA-related protein
VTRLVFAAISLVLASALPASQVFRSGTDAVSVDVLITDGNRPVAGLTAEHFELFDNGVPQRLLASSIADVPLAVMLALDTSRSVEGVALKQLKTGAQAALHRLKPADRAALVTFANDVHFVAPWGSSAAALSDALGSSRAGGTTALYDATFAALTLHDDVAGYRSLLLLFSDGADTASWLPPRAVIEKAEKTDAVVYAVVLSVGDAREAEGTLYQRSGIELSPPQVRSVRYGTPFIQDVAETTGGDVFRTERTGELRDAFARILTEFRSRYLLTYTPTGVDTPGWHSIEVKLKGKKGKVKARRGYSR